MDSLEYSTLGYHCDSEKKADRSVYAIKTEQSEPETEGRLVTILIGEPTGQTCVRKTIELFLDLFGGKHEFGIVSPASVRLILTVF